MSIRLGVATAKLDWGGDALAGAIAAAADRAVAACAVDAIRWIQPGTPYDTGSLESSIHAARPGFADDESAIYDRRTSDDAGDAIRVEPRVPTLAEVLPLVEGGTVWVGSWMSYAYWVERGYFNVLAGRAIAGQHYVMPSAQASMQPENFIPHFRAQFGLPELEGAL